MAYKSNINRIIKRLSENEERALTATGIFIRGEAQVRVPIDTGALRDSIDFIVNDGRKSVVIGTNIEYAPYVEFGTGRYAQNGGGRKTPWVYKNRKGEWVWTEGQRPQPFLTPAFEDNKQKIKKLVARELGRGLK
ncbi:HK97-gp10 family putative phage morphogenesis protein [Thermoactinomyces sp. CICC 23799]|jgi:HK97 gp10 family phage protein|uniref:HK97-gp10 family putative phage morphogenesis protein n=1 Tax=Thermoactinomyces sp. CICC 23799 TaxID=2767429 RepID=UPI0018DB132D|nr:HK97-gp10 family putative phage morphogenesis protein [Thermoactinomyces sp. CICC 23799]MBH8601186.1 HK97 gp10 family phage protein [Thermoactinomyces sp. CICC 23799]